MRMGTSLATLATIGFISGCSGLLTDPYLDSIQEKDEVIIYYTNTKPTPEQAEVCTRDLVDGYIADPDGTILSIYLDADEASCSELGHTEGENCTVVGSPSSSNVCVYGYNTD